MYSGANAIKLCEQYESVEFKGVHECWLPSIRLNASTALDLGCGSGRHAEGLAKLGLDVLAVDASADMLRQATLLHPSSKIEWLLDSLPELALVLRKGRVFDVILLSAVWMHVPVLQRSSAMANLSKLCAPNRIVVVSLRHPPDVSRGMTEDTCEEIIALGAQSSLKLLHKFNTAAALVRSDVTWSFIVFAKSADDLARG